MKRIAGVLAEHYIIAMSTLAEIEAAVETLPTSLQEELFSFLAGKLGRFGAPAVDPVNDVIGAFAGEPGSAGREAEDILYGASATA